ncbi:MAG TPA: SdrD B-like domain-containing protein, partial [Candidatus Sumerlaeota bacterium]|nr:SdrD B-like domain-containing protein [Candidatus Sumerlaeota bacterium]
MKRLIVAVVLCLLAFSSQVFPQSTVGYAEYYLLGDDGQVMESLKTIPSGGVSNSYTAANLVSVLSLVSSADGVHIYIDEWENGYSFDPDNPIATSDARWDSSGGGPGYQGPALSLGQVLTLTKSPANRYCSGSLGINGGDRIYITGAPITIVRTCYPDNPPGSYVSGNFPLYPTVFWDSSYTVPLGTDIQNGSVRPFRITDLHVQVRDDNTRVIVKSPAGVELVNQVLNRGQSLRYAGALVGTTVTGTDATTDVPKPIQAGLVTSPGGSTSRYYTLQPDVNLGYEYYLGVPSMTHPPNEESGRNVDTAAYIYAKDNNTEIEIATKSGTSTITLMANQTYRYLMPRAPFGVYQGFYGARVTSTDPTKKIGVMLACDDGNSNVDWAYHALPTPFLLNEYFVPYGPINPLHFTPVYDNTQFFIDFDSDGNDDMTFFLNRFETKQVLPPSLDFKGAHIRTTGPALVVWGQNDTEFDPGESTPDYDQGYTLLPLYWFSPVLGIEHDAAPSALPQAGGSAQFTIVVKASDYPVYNIDVTDLLPDGWEYVPGTSNVVYSDGSPSNSDDPDESGQLLTWLLDKDLAAGQTITITFTAQTTSGFASGWNVAMAEAYGTSISDETSAEAYIFRPYKPAQVYIAHAPTTTLSASKTSNYSSLDSPDDPIEFTITVSNTGGARADLVSVTDNLPAGLTYVDGSCQVTGNVPGTMNFVYDGFNSNSYSLNLGSQNWANSWTESGDSGSPPYSSGQIYLQTDQGGNNRRLRISGGNQRYIQRRVNLSGQATATLKYIYRRMGLDDANDYVRVLISGDGSNFTEIARYTYANGTGTDNFYREASHEIPSNLITANTTIRFQTSPSLGNADIVFFDNIGVYYAPRVSSTQTGTPPPLLASGYDLLPGESMTVVFKALVNQPLPQGITSFLNTASVASEDSPPVNASASGTFGTIGDFVFNDLNSNGVYNPGQGETGRAGVQISLIGAGADGIFETFDDIVYPSVTTDANGAYLFTGLMPGEYRVTANSPRLTTPNPVETTLNPGDNVDTIDFGVGPEMGTISGHIFNDINGNGVQDAGEPDLSGVDVVITDSLGGTQTVTTDVNGNYTATVPAGSTTANIDETTVPAGSVLTAGSDPQTVIVPGGSNAATDPVGYQQQGTISGHIFNDINGNGVQDAGEPDLAGVDVVITDSLGGTQTVTTDVNGNYTATVPAGSTTANIDETTLPAGSVLTAGSDPQTVNVPGGSNAATAPVGYQQQGTISGHIFNDINGNGVQDA